MADEGERIEEAETNIQYEIIPPSEYNDLHGEPEDVPTVFDTFLSQHLLQRFSHINLSG
jgi:hypothetical protein